MKSHHNERTGRHEYLYQIDINHGNTHNRPTCHWISGIFNLMVALDKKSGYNQSQIDSSSGHYIYIYIPILVSSVATNKEKRRCASI